MDTLLVNCFPNQTKQLLNDLLLLKDVIKQLEKNTPTCTGSIASAMAMEVQQDTIYVSGLPDTTTKEKLVEIFGGIGVIKIDKKTNEEKIWLYKDSDTGKPKGGATITYEDLPTASAAVNWFDGSDFQGCKIKVSLAERKAYDGSRGNSRGGGGGGGGYGSRGGRGSNYSDRGNGSRGYDSHDGRDDRRGGGDRYDDRRGGGGGGSYSRNNRGGDDGKRPPRGRGEDWNCTSCPNVNFARRNECNRCGAPKPEEGSSQSHPPPPSDSGYGQGGAGRSESSGDSYSRGSGRDSGGNGEPRGQSREGDWLCGSCSNKNFAFRNTCNRCNTPRTGGDASNRFNRDSYNTSDKDYASAPPRSDNRYGRDNYSNDKFTPPASGGNSYGNHKTPDSSYGSYPSSGYSGPPGQSADYPKYSGPPPQHSSGYSSSNYSAPPNYSTQSSSYSGSSTQQSSGFSQAAGGYGTSHPPSNYGSERAGSRGSASRSYDSSTANNDKNGSSSVDRREDRRSEDRYHRRDRPY